MKFCQDASGRGPRRRHSQLLSGRDVVLDVPISILIQGRPDGVPAACLAGLLPGHLLHFELMAQLLLIPDPKPLVERLGSEFFRRVPESPGVYLMRDASATVLYVGKAKNLRRRLGSYRVANPERLRRRHLRLLRAVETIEFQHCPDESSALARESELLRELRPRFNRAGVWAGQPRFVAWRLTAEALELAVTNAAEPGWSWYGPTGAGAIPIRAALVRLLWHALRPDRGLAQMPEGWFHGRLPASAIIPVPGALGSFSDAAKYLSRLFSGDIVPFVEWIREVGGQSLHRFALAVLEEDLEAVSRFCSRTGPAA